jgi:hypothetical protein
MTNFIEEQQREVQTKAWAMFAGRNELTAHDVLDEMTNQTITNTLNHILESGLLEEVIPVGDEMVDNPEKERVNREIAGNNTLARAVKELISKMNSV